MQSAADLRISDIREYTLNNTKMLSMIYISSTAIVATGVGGLAFQVNSMKHDLYAEMKKDKDELRAEMKKDKDELRAEMKKDKDELRAEMKKDKDELRAEMRKDKEELLTILKDISQQMKKFESRVNDLERRRCWLW